MLEQRLQSDVAGLRQQHCADTDNQLLGSGIGFADMSKFVGEAGMSIYFQQQLSEIHAGQQGLYLLGYGVSITTSI